MPESDYGQSIFINCPFDRRYQPIFRAIVFAIADCGYTPRCALEIDDAAEVRFEKILTIIRECRLGVHDISRTQLDTVNRLPRFNMPFELGLFLGAARLGGRDGRTARKPKRCLVLDRERYRYQKYLSDIAGQDIRAHEDDPLRAIGELRSWLAADHRSGGGAQLPGGAAIARRYDRFTMALPRMLRRLELTPSEMQFADFTNFVAEWLQDPVNGRSS